MKYLKRPSELSRVAWAAFLVLWFLTILGLCGVVFILVLWEFALWQSKP